MNKNDPNDLSRQLGWLTALLLLQLLAFAGTTAATEEVMTNESVIKMHEAGLPAEVILAKIRTSQTNFDTSVDALVALSEAGIPKDVIADMAGSSSAPSSAAEAIVVRQGATAAPIAASRFAGTPCPSVLSQKFVDKISSGSQGSGLRSSSR
jgi:hypothetical protein